MKYIGDIMLEHKTYCKYILYNRPFRIIHSFAHTHFSRVSFVRSTLSIATRTRQVQSSSRRLVMQTSPSFSFWHSWHFILGMSKETTTIHGQEYSYRVWCHRETPLSRSPQSSQSSISFFSERSNRLLNTSMCLISTSRFSCYPWLTGFSPWYFSSKSCLKSSLASKTTFSLASGRSLRLTTANFRRHSFLVVQICLGLHLRHMYFSLYMVRKRSMRCSHARASVCPAHSRQRSSRMTSKSMPLSRACMRSTLQTTSQLFSKQKEGQQLWSRMNSQTTSPLLRFSVKSQGVKRQAGQRSMKKTLLRIMEMNCDRITQRLLWNTLQECRSPHSQHSRSPLCGRNSSTSGYRKCFARSPSSRTSSYWTWNSPMIFLPPSKSLWMQRKRTQARYLTVSKFLSLRSQSLMPMQRQCSPSPFSWQVLSSPSNSVAASRLSNSRSRSSLTTRPCSSISRWFFHRFSGSGVSAFRIRLLNRRQQIDTACSRQKWVGQ